MADYFGKVISYLNTLKIPISYQSEPDCMVILNAPEKGIRNLVITCRYPIVILEQFIFELDEDSLPLFKALLQKNREITHGAFVIDDKGAKVLFRDTLQLENLDLNELEGSIVSLCDMLEEYSAELKRLNSIN